MGERKKDGVRKVPGVQRYFPSRALDIAQYWLRRSTTGAASGGNRCYANEFSPFESTTLFKLCAGDAPISVGPAPIKQIKFLPEIPTKKSRAPPSCLGVLTSLVRDPCIVSTGGIPFRGEGERTGGVERGGGLPR